MGKVWGIIFLFALFGLVPIVSAADHVIVNSEDWTDVYSGLHYASLQGFQSDFLVSVSHSKILLNSIGKSNDIIVLSSRTNPFAFNYPDLINSEGFTSAREITSRNLNLELLNELEDVKDFIVVDSSYGYSAIAVSPYAVKTNSWVFFANKNNIEEISSVLSQRDVESIIVYGYVDREVREELESYSPKIIYNQDKFQDNVEIVKEYMKINPTKQVLLTNGEFIEKELMLGNQPVLFTGRQNVPDQIRDYIKSSDIEIGVLIGNELLGAATNIRRSAGISVMVKFARGARAPSEGVSSVEGLDLFPLPTPQLGLQIYSVEYNTMMNQLEVTYKSLSNTPVYLKGTITIGDGSNTQRVADNQTEFIAPGNYKTLIYDLDLNSYEGLKAEIYTLFGEASEALDLALSTEAEVNIVEVIDSCEISVQKVVYNKQKSEFEISVENEASVSCWVDISLENIEIGYETVTVATTAPVEIAPSKSGVIIIAAELTDSDLVKTSFVDLTARFGQKETSLVKVLTGTFELKVLALSTGSYVMIGAAAGTLVFFFLFYFRRRKENEFDF